MTFLSIAIAIAAGLAFIVMLGLVILYGYQN